MRVSVCLTVFNEEKSIAKLLDSLLNQSKKPDETVIVDGGSHDNTAQIIRHYQKKNKSIRLLVEKCTRARGRNLSVELARNDIIAMTDGDCVADRNWLRLITDPFKHKEVGISAGFYDMKAQNSFERAESVFLGVLPSAFDHTFLPSTRSIAFRKKSWDKIGGFPEGLDDAAEDTAFNYRALNEGLKFARVKNARVEWRMPDNFKEVIKKIYKYAKGDAKSGIWFHPSKGLMSHNMKSIFKLIRYLAGLLMLFWSFYNPLILLILSLLLILYAFWSFRKVYEEFREIETGLWGIILQFTSDFVVIAGFLRGVTKRL